MNKIYNSLLILILILITTSLQFQGCLSSPEGTIQPQYLQRDTGDVSPTGMHRIKYFFDKKEIRPATRVNYWEERIIDSNDSVRVIESYDSSCSVEPKCLNALNLIRTKQGERFFSFPGGIDQFIYFVGWTGTEAIVWNGTNAIHDFLGPLDTEADAIYWAGHQGYWVEQDSTMIKPTSEGFEFVIKRMESMCGPYRILRVKLLVQRNGKSIELARKTVVEDSTNCVQF